jgi:ubiquinone/menaquinone biosynthesis C-methylase UbiE
MQIADQLKLRNHFNQLASGYDKETSWRLDAQLLKEFKEMIYPVNTGERILDLGCGTGILSHLVNVNDVKMVGVDLSLNMCQLALGRGENTVCADLGVLPFKPGIFSLLMVRQVFQYFYPGQLTEIMREINRISSDGSVLVAHHFTVPEGEPSQWWQTMKKHVQPLRRNILTETELHQLFTEAGWNLEKESHQYHDRDFSLRGRGFTPSERFPCLEKLVQWVERTAERNAPESKVRIQDQILLYTQCWTLTRYRKKK